MKYLRWFFVAVQFIMLAVSIPKVALLFHAYDTETMGPLVGGVDLRSWLVGFAIDLTAMVTTWAALQKYEATGKRLSLLAPGFIIAVCSSLSVVANYEAAATVHPAQYAHVSILEYPALLINPLLISSPPVIVLLLIIVVPAVLARPRIKSVAEVEQELARIDYEARLREAQVHANAKVRGAQLSGLKDTVNVVTGRTEVSLPSVESAHVDELEARIEQPTEHALASPSANVSRAMWNALPLRERVLKSGLITAQEVAEVLGVSVPHARKLTAEGRASSEDKGAVPGRTGAPYQALIDALYARKAKDSFAQAQRLESALGLRKKTRQLHAVGDAGDNPTVPLVDEEESGESVS